MNKVIFYLVNLVLFSLGFLTVFDNNIWAAQTYTTTSCPSEGSLSGNCLKCLPRGAAVGITIIIDDNGDGVDDVDKNLGWTPYFSGSQGSCEWLACCNSIGARFCTDNGILTGNESAFQDNCGGGCSGSTDDYCSTNPDYQSACDCCTIGLSDWVNNTGLLSSYYPTKASGSFCPVGYDTTDINTGIVEKAYCGNPIEISGRYCIEKCPAGSSLGYSGGKFVKNIYDSEHIVIIGKCWEDFDPWMANILMCPEGTIMVDVDSGDLPNDARYEKPFYLSPIENEDLIGKASGDCDTEGNAWCDKTINNKVCKVVASNTCTPKCPMGTETETNGATGDEVVNYYKTCFYIDNDTSEIKTYTNYEKCYWIEDGGEENCLNGILDSGEDCDPTSSTTSQNCSIEGENGTQACTISCTWGECIVSGDDPCGNGDDTDPGEECDPPGTTTTSGCTGSDKKTCSSDCLWSACSSCPSPDQPEITNLVKVACVDPNTGEIIPGSIVEDDVLGTSDDNGSTFSKPPQNNQVSNNNSTKLTFWQKILAFLKSIF